jgi:CheY-like chemotaxis protein
MLFPLAPDDAAGLPASSGEVLQDRTTDGSETILAVDDDEGVLELAVHQLGALDYRVLSARSGEEALDVLRGTAGRVDLLFTDVSMPGGMNGLVLAERARALCPGLRVLFATGYSDDLVNGAMPAHGADVLGKPYSQTDLAGRVRAVLNSRDGHHDIRPVYGG